MMQEGFSWPNISASQTFDLILGGYYLLAVHATFGGGSVNISALTSDNATYVPVTNASLTADGAIQVFLAPGSYRLTVTTATAVYASLARGPVA